MVSMHSKKNGLHQVNVDIVATSCVALVILSVHVCSRGALHALDILEYLAAYPQSSVGPRVWEP